MAVRLGGSGAVMAVHGTVQQVARLGRAALRRLQLGTAMARSGLEQLLQWIFILFSIRSVGRVTP